MFAILLSLLVQGRPEKTIIEPEYSLTGYSQNDLIQPDKE